MNSSEPAGPTVLKVIDALDHPHGNRILRTRIARGEPPTASELRHASLRAVSPDGREVEIGVLGFPAFGGAPTDTRIRATGRVDLLVPDSEDARAISRRWELLVPEG